MLLDSLSPSLASYCFRIKCHISETALNSHFSTLAYFEYFISCIELSFPDIGILNCVNHVLPYMLSCVFSPMKRRPHFLLMSFIQNPAHTLARRHSFNSPFFCAWLSPFEVFLIEVLRGYGNSYVHYPLSPLYCGKFLERRAFGRFISISQNLAHCLTAQQAHKNYSHPIPPPEMTW